MAVLSVTGADISADWDRGAVIANYIAAVACSIGQGIYLDSSNKANPAKADTSAHSQAIGIAVGAPNFYGETTINAGDYVAVCVQGPVSGFASLVSGENIYIDRTTAGKLVDVAPTSAWQYAIGHAIGADTIFVDPGSGSPVSA